MPVCGLRSELIMSHLPLVGSKLLVLSCTRGLVAVLSLYGGDATSHAALAQLNPLIF